MTTETVEIKIEGITLSNAIWRKYRRQPLGFIEKVLALNPGLSANVFIPVGTKIKLPVEDAVNTAAATPNVVRLWD